MGVPAIGQAPARLEPLLTRAAPTGAIRPRTPAYRRASAALFLGGFVTFSTLYCTQPLLPALSRELRVAPAEASLSLSVATGAMAVSLLLAGSLSDAWGRTRLMAASLVAASSLLLPVAAAPGFGALLAARALQGVALAGLPAIAMAYLAEEIDPRSLGAAMGTYVSGTTVGGMSGLIIIGLAAGAVSWRAAVAALGVVCLGASLWFWRSLPPQRNFRPRPFALGRLAAPLARQLRDPGLACLFGIAFLLMGGFVTMYNYVGYQLVAPPYGLSQSAVGLVFVVYVLGTFSAAWMGRVADRVGRRETLWAGIAMMASGVAVTLASSFAIKIAGVGIATFGFFGAHSVASGWVGRRARGDRAQAASLYLFGYYAGSSVGGWAGGLF